MENKLLIGVFFLLWFTNGIYSCPVWADPRKQAYHAGPQAQPEEHESEQWPLAAWADPAVHQTRVRRRDPDLIPLDLEVFRRENLGPKPVWRDPHLHEDNSHNRKHNSNTGDED